MKLYPYFWVIINSKHLEYGSLRLCVSAFSRLALLCLIFPFALQAQNSIFDYAPPESLDSKQTSVLEEYERHPLYHRPRMLQFNDFEKLAGNNEGTVQLQLPDSRGIISFQFTNAYQDNQGSSWYAETLDADGKSDYFGSLQIITSLDAPNFMGTISYGDAFYEFMPVDESYSIIYRVDTEQLKEGNACGTESHHRSPKQLQAAPPLAPEKSSSQPCGRGRVTILLITSPAAREAIPANNINNVINTAVFQLKQSLANSYVSADNLDIMTVSPVIATDFVEGNDVFTDAQSLRSDYEALRIANDADLVVMFTDGTEGTGGTNSRGYDRFNGAVEDIGIDPLVQYAIVQIEHATSKSFAHEVGHLLGGRHANDPLGTINHGIILCKWRGTIMTTAREIFGSGSNRILYFSTPLKNECGAPMGNNTNRNMGLFLNQNGQTVANFVPNTGNFNFSAWVSGPWNVCLCNYATFTANTRCNNGNVTYQWHRSVNGGAYQFVGSGASYDNWFSCSTTNGTNYVVRLTATDSQGNVSISTKFGSVGGYGCGSWISTPSPSVKTDKLQVYPSPVDGRGDRKISVIPPQDFQEGHLTIYHTNGKAVYQDAAFSIMDKSNSLTLPSSSPSGLYYIVLRDKNNTTIHTTPLIIQ